MLAPEPGFVMYRMIAAFTGMDYVGVPLAADFALDGAAMLAAIAAHEPALVFLAYPNNPTGNLFDAEAMRAVIEAAPGLVVIDEAYYPFAGSSYLGWLGRHPNLLVMRTVSKLGLAGLRLGLLAGPEAWLGQLEKLRLPYNINVLTQSSAEFALAHHHVFEQQAAQICADRERLYRALSELPGIAVWPSHANFLLLRTPAGQSAALFAGLKAHGVLVKNLDGGHPQLRDCLRVTVGTAGENRAFLEALRALLTA
jgi:histidinol-phosphate aminotransferase